MGILDGQNQSPIPPASVAADRIIAEAREVWARLVLSFNESAIFFWQNPDGLTPIQIAEALGTSGKEVFQLHGKLGELIASIKPAAIADGLSVVGQFSYREDGSVNIENQPQN